MMSNTVLFGLKNMKFIFVFREQKMVRARATKRKKIKRYAMIGAASGFGGVLIGRI